MIESPTLIINDCVYDREEITEPVLIDIINSREMRRTEGISQLGIPQEYHPLKTFSRASHMRGATIAVRRAGGSLEEQVAACTHDLSHAAFSHMIDWMLRTNDKDDHQDNIHAE